MDVLTLDKEKITRYIANRLLKSYARRYKDDPVWAWGQVTSAVSSATTAEKKEIIALLENASIVRRAINNAARAEADQIVSDDVLTLEEFARIVIEGD